MAGTNIENQIKLWEILIPTMFEDNHKPVSLKHHKSWDSYVLKISDGLTILKPAKGYWIYEDQKYEDRVIPVRIACASDEIRIILAFTRQHYRQVAVMAYEISNNVIFYPDEP